MVDWWEKRQDPGGRTTGSLGVGPSDLVSPSSSLAVQGGGSVYGSGVVVVVAATDRQCSGVVPVGISH